MQESRARDRSPAKGDKSNRRKVDLGAVRELVEPIVLAHGLELVEVEWQSTHHGKILRVIIERPMDDGETPIAEEPNEPGGLTPIAGVGLEDCVAVSRDLSTVFDVEGEDVAGLPEGRYNLEVSSPGLDRPLRTLRDFRRQVGRLAKIKLLEPAIDGQRVLRGTITSVDDISGDEAGIQMTVDGKLHQVRLDNIDVAKLVFELPQQPKPRSSKKGRSSSTRKGQSNKGKARKGRSKRGGAK